jgi:hypothetical protein
VKSRIHVAVGAALAVAALVGTAGISYASSHKDRTVLKAETMVGVHAPFVKSPENAIRGVVGAGAPWVIDEAKIELKASGKLEVEVEGLVLGPSVPAPRGGTNPIPQMRVTVSCISVDAAGAVVTSNVSTGADEFAVDTAGDGEVETMVSLPSPCIAPIVFIGSTPTNWFAVTGTD